jgi:hypothetical protein
MLENTVGVPLWLHGDDEHRVLDVVCRGACPLNRSRPRARSRRAKIAYSRSSTNPSIKAHIKPSTLESSGIDREKERESSELVFTVAAPDSIDSSRSGSDGGCGGTTSSDSGGAWSEVADHGRDMRGEGGRRRRLWDGKMKSCANYFRASRGRTRFGAKTANLQFHVGLFDNPLKMLTVLGCLRVLLGVFFCSL